MLKVTQHRDLITRAHLCSHYKGEGERERQATRVRGTRTLSPVPCVSDSCQKARHGALPVSDQALCQPGAGRISHLALGCSPQERSPAPGTSPACRAAKGAGQSPPADSPPLLLLSLSPGAMGARAERQRGEAGLAGWVIASYRQVDDCHRRLPEDMETEPLLRPAAPGAGCQLSAQGSRFPSPSH